MEQAPSFEFVDGLTGDGAVVTVRYDETSVEIGLFTDRHGDIEATMGRGEAVKVYKAVAAAAAEGRPSPGRRTDLGDTPLMLTEALYLPFINRGEVVPEPAWLLIRYDAEMIAIGLFVQGQRAIEVVMGQDSAPALLAAVQAATGGWERAEPRIVGAEKNEERSGVPKAAVFKFADASGVGWREAWAIVGHDDTSVSLRFLVSPGGDPGVILVHEGARALLALVEEAVAGMKEGPAE